jgi:hypothetical protein
MTKFDTPIGGRLAKNSSCPSCCCNFFDDKRRGNAARIPVDKERADTIIIRTTAQEVTMAPKDSQNPESPPPSPPPQKSPPLKPTGSRNSSFASQSRRGSHAPHYPSGLRRSIVPRESSSPEDALVGPHDEVRGSDGKKPSMPEMDDDGIRPSSPNGAETGEYHHEHHAEQSFWNPIPNIRSRLLGHDNWDAASGCGSENCGHGTFSPRPLSPRQGSVRTYGSFSSQISQAGFGGAYADGEGAAYGESADLTHGLLGDSVADGLLGGGNGNKMSTTDYLAQRHGIKSRRWMYVQSPSFLNRYCALTCVR